jgi:chromosome segregation ATPase
VQQSLRASQQKLDSIQAERTRLQREMEGLQSRVRDASRELLNIERQREVSRSALLELEFQTQLLLENVERTELEHHAHDAAAGAARDDLRRAAARDLQARPRCTRCRCC